MPRLTKKAKKEWAFFLNAETGRRSYNELCRKCQNNCKQSYRAIIVNCPKYHSKRSVKNAPNSNGFSDSG